MGYSWTYGAAGSGLSFEINYSDGVATLSMNEGSMDLNLWFSNGDDVADGDTSLSGKDNSLNMNGTSVIWDSYAKISDTGLKDGVLIEASAEGDPVTTVNLTEFFPELDFASLGSLTLGVRATSVNGDESIKLFDTTQVLGFEDDFAKWETIGSTSISQENVTEGNNSAELNSNSTVLAGEIAGFLGTTEADLEANTGGTNLTTGSAIKTTLDVVTGEEVSFDYTWSSGEVLNSVFNDTSLFVTFDGMTMITEIADASDPSGSGTISFTATTTGELELGVAVFNGTDAIINSELFIDNVVVA